MNLRFSISVRLFLALNGLALLMSLITLIVVDRVVKRKVGEDFSAHRQRAAEVCRQFSESRFAALETGLTFMEGSSDFQALMSADGIDHDTYLFTLQSLQKTLGAEMVALVGADGKVKARTDKPAESGTDFSSQPLIRAGTGGKAGRAVWLEGARAQQMVCRPVVVGGQVRGCLLAGVALDVKAAQALQGMLECDVALCVGSSIAATTTDGELPAELLRSLAADSTDAMIAVSLKSRRYQAFPAAVTNERSGLGEKASAVLLVDEHRMTGFYSLMRWLLIGLGVCGQAVALGVTYFFVHRTVTRPLRALTGRVDEIASGEGDLTRTIDESSRDELGDVARAFNRFVAKLRAMITEVKHTSGNVSGVAARLRDQTGEISHAVTRQSGEMQQIAAAMRSVIDSTGRINSRAGEAAGAAADSRGLARQGGEAVQSTVAEMGAISADVRSSATNVDLLGQKVQQISGVIQVIQDIADQTNLLALNAAIEAARAGEHGRGFAVVADEVRKLAERTTRATSEVITSINDVQAATTEAVGSVQRGAERVGRGVDLARTAGATLDRILNGSAHVDEVITAISDAAREQQQASDAAGRSLAEVETAIGASSRAVEQAAAAATELSAGAAGLHALAARFRV